MCYGGRGRNQFVSLAPGGEGPPCSLIDAVGGGPAGSLNDINDPGGDVDTRQEVPLNLQTVNWYHWESGCTNVPWRRAVLSLGILQGRATESDTKSANQGCRGQCGARRINSTSSSRSFLMTLVISGSGGKA